MDHFYGTGKTVCPDTSSLAHIFGVGWMIYPGVNPSTHSFGAGWVAQLDVSCSIAHFFDAGHKEAKYLSCSPSSGHTSSEIVTLVTIISFASF